MPPAEPATPIDDGVLEAITDAIVALHFRYYHRVPTTAGTKLLGEDLIACSLTGIYTDVEKTMIELGRHDVVRSTRQEFQAAVGPRFTGAVEALTGRTVRAFISDVHVGPDLAVELFLLD